jgi:hypothetical protein
MKEKAGVRIESSSKMVELVGDCGDEFLRTDHCPRYNIRVAI